MKKSVTLQAYINLLPALLVLTVLFLGGLISAIAQSVGYFPVIGMHELTLKYYHQVLGHHEFLASLLYTFYIALVSTLLATVLGVFLAWYLTVKTQGRAAGILYRLPIAVPHLVAALMLVFLLSQGGMIARLVMHLGMIKQNADFPALFYSRNALGIILIYLWKEIPFIAFMVYGVMKNIQSRLGEAASNLKANSRQTFFYVTLPLSMPSIISASAIVFAYSFGAFELPYLLGASYPKTLPVSAYNYYISTQLTDRPAAMVINTLLALICAALVAVYYQAMRKYLQQWG